MRMPTYWTGQQIQPGDWVRVYSSRFGVWHHGIVRRLVLVPGGIAARNPQHTPPMWSQGQKPTSWPH